MSLHRQQSKRMVTWAPISLHRNMSEIGEIGAPKNDEQVRLVSGEVHDPPLHYTKTKLPLILGLNFCCFLLHVSFGIATLIIARGKDTSILLTRIEATFVAPGLPYTYNVVEARFQFLNLKIMTCIFFWTSALSHCYMSVIAHCFPKIQNHIAECITNCTCYWRYVEYSLSASVMLVVIGISVSIRDQNTVKRMPTLTCIGGSHSHI